MRQFLGHVAEEFLSSLVPLDGVERLVLQIIAAEERDGGACSDGQRYPDGDVPKPANP